jgi:hypothetical protein
MPNDTNRLLAQSALCFGGVGVLVLLSFLGLPWPVRVALLVGASVLLVRGGAVADAYRRRLR